MAGAPSPALTATGSAIDQFASAAFAKGDPGAELAGRIALGTFVERQADADALKRALPPVAPEIVEEMRRDAEARLADFARRWLHNHVTELKAEAVREHLQTARLGARPLAVLVAAFIASAAALTLLPLWQSLGDHLMGLVS